MNSVKARIENLSVNLIAACLFGSLLAYADGSSPVGRWKAFDEDTGEPTAIIEIQQQGGALYGWVDKLLEQQKNEEPPRCTECEGELKNAPVIGLRFIQNMQHEDDDWRGHILDPETGKIYNATMSVVEGDQKLEVRGYIGIPLLGRTQIWERAQ